MKRSAFMNFINTKINLALFDAFKQKICANPVINFVTKIGVCDFYLHIKI